MKPRKTFGVLDDPDSVEGFEIPSMGEIVEVGQRLYYEAPTPRPAESTWHYVVNSDMSGMPVVCAALDCRAKKLADTASFAALYADQVVLYNPLASSIGYLEKYHPDWTVDDLDDAVGQEIAFGVSSYLSLQPLINAGVATFVDFEPENVCLNCLDKAMKSGFEIESAGSKFLISYQDYLNTAVVKYEDEWDDRYVVRVESEFVDPGHDISYIYVLKEFAGANFDELSFGDTLSPEKLHDLSIFTERASFGSADLISRSVVADRYQIGTIFSDSTESFVLKKVFGDEFVTDRFSLDMPFLATRNLESVLRLREKHEEQFLNFRRLFSDLSLDPSESRPEVLEKIQAEILPKLYEVRRLIENERENAKSALFDSGVISVAALAASLMTAGTSSLVSGAAAILGGGHFANSVVPNLRKLATEPQSAKESKMYFAWKVLRETSKK